ncbi:hypothetical protein [Mesorhizobium silamurunense]|uniref:hypothetical protein n=1 Tax=Mesorhizobium silamurunense TaxID=499528 RepID=UPI00177C8B3B|nr:hypothetical protein [Mesorhizobium silamurunense]
MLEAEKEEALGGPGAYDYAEDLRIRKEKEHLEKDRNDPASQRSSLIGLLSAHTTIAHIEDGPPRITTPQSSFATSSLST